MSPITFTASLFQDDPDLCLGHAEDVREQDLLFQIDQEALESFACPTFGPNNAVELEVLPAGIPVILEGENTLEINTNADALVLNPCSNDDQAGKQGGQDVEMEEPRKTNGLEFAFESLAPPEQLMPMVLQPLEIAPNNKHCTYRKGKCTQPRTVKKNGALHSFCEYHRLRSIRNQKTFDQKRRLMKQKLETNCHNGDSRSGLSVPAPQSTKKHHGHSINRKTGDKQTKLTKSRRVLRSTSSDAPVDLRYHIAYINDNAAAIV